MLVSNVGAGQFGGYAQIVSENEKQMTVINSTALKEYVRENPEYIPTVHEKAILGAVESTNKQIQGAEKEFEFSFHEGTKQVMLKIINKENKTVIREIPPEKILDLITAMCQKAGVFVDEKR
ncbi:MAG: flagellar protein FlaG [Cellulosilyticaceae bacterium]